MISITRYLSLISMTGVGRRTLRCFLTGALAAAASTVSTTSFASTLFASALADFEVAHFLPRQTWIVASGALVYAVTFGYGARSATGQPSFGARSRANIALIGCWLAFAVYAWRFGHGGAEGPLGFIIVAIFASLALPLGVAGHAFPLDELNRLIPGRRRKVSAAYERVVDPPPPGPPAHRMLAAMRVRRPESAPDLNDGAMPDTPASNAVASE